MATVIGGEELNACVLDPSLIPFVTTEIINQKEDFVVLLLHVLVKLNDPFAKYDSCHPSSCIILVFEAKLIITNFIINLRHPQTIVLGSLVTSKIGLILSNP